MAHPSTLSDAVRRIAAGEAAALVWAGLLDRFYLCAAVDERRAILRDEPPPTGDVGLDCLAAAAAEYLWKQNALGSPIPAWIRSPSRIMAEPWFMAPGDIPAIREYLSFASPAEFIHHNIFTDETPFRRARRPLGAS